MTYKATIIFNDTADSSVASTTQTIENVFDYRFGESVLILDTRGSASDTPVLTAYPWATIVQSKVDSVSEPEVSETEDPKTEATVVEATPAGADTENTSESSSETPEA